MIIHEDSTLTNMCNFPCCELVLLQHAQVVSPYPKPTSRTLLTQCSTYFAICGYNPPPLQVRVGLPQYDQHQPKSRSRSWLCFTTAVNLVVNNAQCPRLECRVRRTRVICYMQLFADDTSSALSLNKCRIVSTCWRCYGSGGIRRLQIYSNASLG